MLKRIFNAKRKPAGTDYLSGAEFNAPIQTFLEQALRAKGFGCVKAGKWVEEHNTQMRRVIEVWHFKGAASGLGWGYSLSYAPHFDNQCRKLHWHRTYKSARLDIFPFDEIEQSGKLTRFARHSEHDKRVRDVLGSVLKNAETFFARVRTIEDVLTEFERLSRCEGTSLGYWNFSNVPIAHAFTLGIAGRKEEGRAILQEYVDRMGIRGPVIENLWLRYSATN